MACWGRSISFQVMVVLQLRTKKNKIIRKASCLGDGKMRSSEQWCSLWKDAAPWLEEPGRSPLSPPYAMNLDAWLGFAAWFGCWGINLCLKLMSFVNFQRKLGWGLFIAFSLQRSTRVKHDFLSCQTSITEWESTCTISGWVLLLHVLVEAREDAGDPSRDRKENFLLQLR